MPASTDTVAPNQRTEMFLTHSPGAAHSAFRLDEVLPTLKQRTVALIDQHLRQSSDPSPLFLYLPLNSPHLPVAPSQPFIGKSGAGLYGDFAVETDDFVGSVMQAFERNQALENTLIYSPRIMGTVAQLGARRSGRPGSLQADSAGEIYGGFRALQQREAAGYESRHL